MIVVPDTVKTWQYVSESLSFRYAINPLSVSAFEQVGLKLVKPVVSIICSDHTVIVAPDTVITLQAIPPATFWYMKRNLPTAISQTS